jgi:transposase-like protein
MRKPSPPAKPEPELEKFERWTAQRKAAIILEVLKGQISVPEACRKHGITQGEFRAWRTFVRNRTELARNVLYFEPRHPARYGELPESEKTP